ATIIGSWIASAIRVYHDSRKAHLDDLRQKVLVPLADATGEDFQHLVSHDSPVITEQWAEQGSKKYARVTEADVEEGSGLTSVNPLLSVFSSIDKPLYEDAKQTHFRKLIEETVKLANSWNAHVERCRSWVEQIAGEILAKSGMHPYGQSFDSPYI